MEVKSESEGSDSALKVALKTDDNFCSQQMIKSETATNMKVQIVSENVSDGISILKTDDNICETISKTDSIESMDSADSLQVSKIDEDVKNQSNTEDKDEVNKNSGMTSENTNIKNVADDKTKSKQTNPLKRKRPRTRPIKRRKKQLMNLQGVYKAIIAAQRTVESDTSVETVNIPLDTCKEEKEYCLTVSNLPNSWSFMEIKNYIDTECGPVDEIEMIKDDKTVFGSIRLSYQNEEECKNAMQKLQDKEVSGNKLTLEMTVESLDSDSDTKSDTTDSPKKPWKPDLDSWEIDADGMYGLKLQFLKTLQITPPLDKWVHVSNFRCDKSELRDVMEMAGNVQMCSVFLGSNRYANIMYSHPLEAVQAVSMLNNQPFYGLPLKVAMDRSPIDTVLLPKGLASIGQGLGFNGKPLRNIVKHYERFVEDKDCSINPVMFDIPENHSMLLNEGAESEFKVKSVEEFNYPIAVDKERKMSSTPPAKTMTIKPVNISSLKPAIKQTPAFTASQPRPVRANFTPAPQQNFQQGFATNFRPFNQMMNGQTMARPQGPQGYGPIGPPNQGPMGLSGVGPIGPRNPGHMGPPMQGPRPPQFARPFPASQVGPARPAWGPGPGPMRPGFPNEPVKLLLANLPPSTTFALLCEKMSEWGHVVCLQLTNPGCAVVTFANRMQADACYQYLNGLNIENHVVQVTYG